MFMRTLLVSALLLVLGCDKSDSPKKGDGGGSDGTGAPACAANLVGTWKMVSVFCGDSDVTLSIGTQGGISDMRLQLSDKGTSCGVLSAVSGPTCAETEALALVPDAAGTFSVVSQGITDCQPVQCVFNASDQPCALGDRAGEASTTSLKLDGDTLTMTSQPPSGMCGGSGAATIISYVRS
jgi:hypothetical protein